MKAFLLRSSQKTPLLLTNTQKSTLWNSCCFVSCSTLLTPANSRHKDSALTEESGMVSYLYFWLLCTPNWNAHGSTTTLAKPKGDYGLYPRIPRETAFGQTAHLLMCWPGKRIPARVYCSLLFPAHQLCHGGSCLSLFLALKRAPDGSLVKLFKTIFATNMWQKESWSELLFFRVGGRQRKRKASERVQMWLKVVA